MYAPSLSFQSKCPKGHLPRLTFEKTLLVRLIDAGSLRLYCGECDKNFVPEEGEKAARRRMAEEPS